MATLPLVAVEDYLATSYSDGDREYLDGVITERNMGTPEHSSLQRILIVYLSSIARELNLSVLPECRLQISQTRYRVPDIVVMERPFRRSGKALLKAPLMVIEILSPEDRMGETLERFREYQERGVAFIIQMDPVRRTAHLFIEGDLVRMADPAVLSASGGPTLQMPVGELLAELDNEEPVTE